MHLIASDVSFAYPGLGRTVSDETGRAVVSGAGTRRPVGLEGGQVTVSGPKEAGPDVFSHVSLRVSDGVRLGLVGENGSGKSTLLHLLAGALKPKSGTVRRSGTLAVVEQELVPTPGETVGDVVRLGAPEPVEDGVTFEENALIKARALARATGLPAVADDSGLAVDVLGGSPGIFSARWAGRHGDDQANLDLLLGQLGEISDPRHLRAGFVCAAALVTADGTETVLRGEMRGTLVHTPRGTNGFGYDPILVPDDQAPAADGTPGTLTSAELSPQEKNAISHRGKAFRALAPAIAEALR